MNLGWRLGGSKDIEDDLIIDAVPCAIQLSIDKTGSATVRTGGRGGGMKRLKLRLDSIVPTESGVEFKYKRKTAKAELFVGSSASWLAFNRSVYRVQERPRERVRTASTLSPTNGATEISAPLPGKVLNVLVREGDSVGAGSPLLTIESMKMEHRISTPSQGVVDKIAVEAGESVNAGRLLVKIRAAGIPTT